MARRDVSLLWDFVKHKEWVEEWADDLLPRDWPYFWKMFWMGMLFGTVLGLAVLASCLLYSGVLQRRVV